MKLKTQYMIILLLSVFQFCSQNDITGPNGMNPDMVTVAPKISFVNGSTTVSPTNVNKIKLKITCGNKIIEKTFDYNLHKAKIKDIPTLKSFTIQVGGIDINGIEIYHGEVKVPGVSKDTTVKITVTPVTPIPPTNPGVKFVTNQGMNFTWNDVSNNESGFIIERKASGESSYKILDSVPANSQLYIDASITDLSIFYTYRAKAYNSAGQSGTISIHTVTTPSKPVGDTDCITNASYYYNTGGASSAEGVQIAYRFHWVGTDTTEWLNSSSITYKWVNQGTFLVQAQARCRDQINSVSAWSEGLTVNVK